MFMQFQKHGDRDHVHSHPAISFVQKYRKLLTKGYKEEKAFALIEAELTEVLEGQRDDLRLLRGGALALHGDSYLDRA